MGRTFRHDTPTMSWRIHERNRVDERARRRAQARQAALDWNSNGDVAETVDANDTQPMDFGSRRRRRN